MYPILARWLTAMLTLAAICGARASENTAFVTARDRVSLVSLSDSAVPGGPIRLGLQFRLAEGWHTYWSNPGDAGAPPTVEVTGGQAGPLAFPVPQLLREGSFTSYAYTGEVLLPFTVTPAGGGGLATIGVHASWLVCATVCVPEDATFTLTLPAGAGEPGAQAPLFAAADARMPRPAPFPVHIAPDGTLWLAAAGLHLSDALFFPAEPGVIDQGAAQRLTVGLRHVGLALKPLKPLTGPLAGVLRLTDPGGAVEALAIQATPAALPAETGGGGGPGFAEAVLLAFAGGLVLNLMPCVLPVLAIKALSLARLSGAARGHVRREAASYTLGVLVAFAAIGALILGGRALGAAASGWGVQFQSTAFTGGMAALLFAVGLNLSGVFEIGGRASGLGQRLAARGSFFTGLLAVVVATPCTAPFMGAALAAALALPPAAGFLVFLALGLGMAAPYAALALSPQAVGLIPRPGAWMDTLRRLLAFPMYGAALWLVWVASQQTGPEGMALVLGAILLAGFAAWAYGTAQMRERPRALRAGALAAMACILAVLVALAAAPPLAARGGPSQDGSEPYSAARLAALRAAHRPVFVDMGAAWCVTCLVNEHVALTPPSVRAAFARRGVTLLKGDWTRQDAGITAFLQAHDRSGVPLYVYFPATGEPRVLPQILTPSLVVDVVEG